MCHALQFSCIGSCTVPAFGYLWRISAKLGIPPSSLPCLRVSSLLKQNRYPSRSGITFILSCKTSVKQTTWMLRKEV